MRTVVVVGLTLLVLIATVARGVAARRDWIGSAACGRCHPAELAGWQRSAHARATRSPGVTPRSSPTRPSARCAACHTTGEAPLGAIVEAAVGCEACHGAGAAYGEDDVMRDPRLAAALGLRDLTSPAGRAAACAGCHRGDATRLSPLDLASAPVH